MYSIGRCGFKGEIPEELGEAGSGELESGRGIASN